LTPAVRAAEEAGIEFRLHEYSDAEYGEGDYAVAVARELGVDPARLFKTLVASVGDDLLVFVVPSERQLDLRGVGKGARMADRARVERVTGYPAGGISPLGQRRLLPTTIDESALAFDTILVSAGRRGLQMELDPRDLARLTAGDIRAVAAAPTI
jgi:Cys-tRNA(Pro)/Cys-tRNA(Cys) deacylase